MPTDKTTELTVEVFRIKPLEWEWLAGVMTWQAVTMRYEYSLCLLREKCRIASRV